MSCKYAAPFATLVLVQNAGGAYTRDVTSSVTITPSLNREKFSGSVDTDFVLALPFHHVEPDCVGVSTRGAERCYRRSLDILLVDSRVAYMNLQSIKNV